MKGEEEKVSSFLEVYAWIRDLTDSEKARKLKTSSKKNGDQVQIKVSSSII